MTNVGFTFKEKMAGGFAMGETDPAAGEALGKASGDVLTMHGTIVIDDLHAFYGGREASGVAGGECGFSSAWSGDGLDQGSVQSVFADG